MLASCQAATSPLAASRNAMVLSRGRCLWAQVRPPCRAPTPPWPPSRNAMVLRCGCAWVPVSAGRAEPASDSLAARDAPVTSNAPAAASAKAAARAAQEILKEGICHIPLHRVMDSFGLKTAVRIRRSEGRAAAHRRMSPDHTVARTAADGAYRLIDRLVGRESPAPTLPGLRVPPRGHDVPDGTPAHAGSR